MLPQLPIPQRPVQVAQIAVVSIVKAVLFVLLNCLAAMMEASVATSMVAVPLLSLIAVFQMLSVVFQGQNVASEAMHHAVLEQLVVTKHQGTH